MNIVLVARDSWNLHNYRQGIIKELIRQGNTITLIGHPEAEYVKKLEKIGANFFPLPFANHSILILLKNFFSLYLFYKKEKPDLVHNFTIKPVIFSTIAARLAGVKVVVNTVTGLGYSFGRTSNTLFRYFIKVLYKLSLHLSSHTFFQNKNDLQFFQQENIITSTRASTVPGSGIDIDYFKPIPYTEKTPIVLLHARLIEDKGHSTFIEVADKVARVLPSVQFWILGKKDQHNPNQISEERLRMWRKKKNVTVLPETNDVRPVIARSMIVVLPSYYREGVPRSLMEGAALEKPLIASDIPGCRDIIEHAVNGLLVPVGNSTALAEAIISLIKNPLTAQRMGRQGLKKVRQEFDEKIVITKTLACYQRLYLKKQPPIKT